MWRGSSGQKGARIHPGAGRQFWYGFCKAFHAPETAPAERPSRGGQVIGPHFGETNKISKEYPSGEQKGKIRGGGDPTIRWMSSKKKGGLIMQTVIRTYSGKGAKELFDLLEKHTADVERLIRSVKGFVSYSLSRSADGGFSVTVCQDKAGVDESLEKARDWIAKNAGSTGVAAPKVSEGSVLIHLK